MIILRGLYTLVSSNPAELIVSNSYALLFLSNGNPDESIKIFSGHSRLLTSRARVPFGSTKFTQKTPFHNSIQTYTKFFPCKCRLMTQPQSALDKRPTKKSHYQTHELTFLSLQCECISSSRLSNYKLFLICNSYLAFLSAQFQLSRITLDLVSH